MFDVEPSVLFITKILKQPSPSVKSVPPTKVATNHWGSLILISKTKGLSTATVSGKTAFNYDVKPKFIEALKLKIICRPFSCKCSLLFKASTTCLNNMKSEYLLVRRGYLSKKRNNNIK